MDRREGKQRKIRSDKKWAIAPYIPDAERVWIHRIARRCDVPEGDVGVLLLKLVLRDKTCMDFFAQYFKRDYRFDAHITYCGHKDAKSIYSYLHRDAEQQGRYKIKASQELYDALCEVQIAFGLPYLAHATHALLQYALHDLETVRRLAPGMTVEDLTGPVKKPMKAINRPGKAWSIFN